MPQGDAARAAGIKLATLRRWLQRGREGEGQEYVDFLRAVESAQADGERRKPTGTMNEDELLDVVSEAARRGSVQAMRLYA